MDAAAIDRALAELRPSLLRIARLQLRNDAWAEDVVSETLIAALEGRERFGGQSQLKTWVVGILKHKIIDHFRRGGREVSVDAMAEDSDEAVDALFHADGHRVSLPLEWGDPEASLSQRAVLRGAAGLHRSAAGQSRPRFHDARMARVRHRRDL